MSLLSEGDRTQITGGKYNGRRGTVLKINRVRHQINVDDIGIGWVTRTFCSRIIEVTTEPITPPRTSRLSSHHNINGTNVWKEAIGKELAQINEYETFRVLNDDEYLTTEDSTNDYSAVPRHGTDVTSQVLMDLLAKSIAMMNLDDEHIEEWTQQLHDRIIHFRHGH
jgi:ribosomal protein L24